MTQNKSLYFLVEGGRTLELAKAHVDSATVSRKRNAALAKELGAERFCESPLNGSISGVFFDKDRHPDFAKPNKHGASSPKKNSQWYRRFSENKGYDKLGFDLAKELGVPTTINYSTQDSDGWSSIAGGFYSGTGFLWISGSGPFALYVPNVAARVADYESRGYTVDDECKNFRPEFDGARPILKEEWQLIVAQRRVAELKGEAA